MNNQEKVKDFDLQSFDARDWAKEFNRILVTKNEQPYDEGWLIGWFANAIMAGYDKAKRENLELTSKYERIMVSYRVIDIELPSGRWKALVYKDNTKEQCEWIQLDHFLELTNLKPLDEKEVESCILEYFVEQEKRLSKEQIEEVDKKGLWIADLKSLTFDEIVKGIKYKICSHFSKPVIKYPEKINPEHCNKHKKCLSWTCPECASYFSRNLAIDDIKALNKEDV